MCMQQRPLLELSGSTSEQEEVENACEEASKAHQSDLHHRSGHKKEF